MRANYKNRYGDPIRVEPATVQELISMLMKFDPNEEVFITSGGDRLAYCTSVEKEEGLGVVIGGNGEH